jgi:hypothetical protein
MVVLLDAAQTLPFNQVEHGVFVLSIAYLAAAG